MEYYNLDHANYITSPGLAWGARLLQTMVELQLINDVDLLSMIEKQRRGGLCYVGSKPHVKANNKYMPDHHPKADSNCLMYLVVNS